MAQLSSLLSPKLIWQFFEQICSIPTLQARGQVERLIVSVGPGRRPGGQTRRRATSSSRSKATPAWKTARPVVLQGPHRHGALANADTQHDFTKDPIDAYIDGEWVTARGTTGCRQRHGHGRRLGRAGRQEHRKLRPLEVLLTTDEETGMTGAFGLERLAGGRDPAQHRLREDGEVYMGCAGGVGCQYPASPWSRLLPPRGRF